MMRRCGGVFALVPATTPAAVFAQTSPAPPADEADSEDIVVVGQSGEQYRLTADALRDAMQAYRQGRPIFAPDARLLFAVSTTSGSLDGLALQLRHTKREHDGQRRAVDLPIDPQGRFSIPDTIPADGTWELRVNRRRDGLRVRPLVLSPGTAVSDDGRWTLSSNRRAEASAFSRASAPAGTAATTDRRLGDLRLQCRVLLAFVRVPGPLRLMVDGFNFCANRRFGLTLKSPHPLANATLRWAGHDTPLDLYGDSYRVPLADRTIPDDARLGLTYR